MISWWRLTYWDSWACICIFSVFAFAFQSFASTVAKDVAFNNSCSFSEYYLNCFRHKYQKSELLQSKTLVSLSFHHYFHNLFITMLGSTLSFSRRREEAWMRAICHVPQSLSKVHNWVAPSFLSGGQHGSSQHSCSNFQCKDGTKMKTLREERKWDGFANAIIQLWFSTTLWYNFFSCGRMDVFKSQVKQLQWLTQAWHTDPGAGILSLPKQTILITIGAIIMITASMKLILHSEPCSIRHQFLNTKNNTLGQPFGFLKTVQWRKIIFFLLHPFREKNLVIKTS